MIRYLPFILFVVLAGCKVSVEPDPEARRQVEQASDVARDAASQAGRRASEGVQQATDKAEMTTQQAMNTGAIKAAFMNRKDIATRDMEVNTVGMNVYLRGGVPNRSDVSKIEEVVKAVAGPGYKIVNELKVGVKP